MLRLSNFSNGNVASAAIPKFSDSSENCHEEFLRQTWWESHAKSNSGWKLPVIRRRKLNIYMPSKTLKAFPWMQEIFQSCDFSSLSSEEIVVERICILCWVLICRTMQVVERKSQVRWNWLSSVTTRQKIFKPIQERLCPISHDSYGTKERESTLLVNVHCTYVIQINIYKSILYIYIRVFILHLISSIWWSLQKLGKWCPC